MIKRINPTTSKITCKKNDEFILDGKKYEIFIQLNKFVFDGKLLPDTMPLNIRDTMITAEIHMNTHGQIAHDIWYNLAGEMDISLDGGYLMGMSIDNFYASADKITTLNAEYALDDMLSVGETKIKSMHIIGKYNNGDFITTQPLRLALSNTDVGILSDEKRESCN